MIPILLCGTTLAKNGFGFYPTNAGFGTELVKEDLISFILIKDLRKPLKA